MFCVFEAIDTETSDRDIGRSHHLCVCDYFASQWKMYMQHDVGEGGCPKRSKRGKKTLYLQQIML